MESILDRYKSDRALAHANTYSDRRDALHPLEIVGELSDVVTPDVTVCLDMGTFHIWLARYDQPAAHFDRQDADRSG